MSENLTDFEQFLMLDDVKGNFKEQADAMLADIQAQKAQEAELFADDSADVDEPVYDDQFDGADFESMFDSDDFLFEDEEGTSSKTNPNKKEKEADQVDDDNFLQDDEETDTDETDQADAPDYDGQAEDETPTEAYALNYDDYIQLPDGREMSIEDLSSAYLESERRAQLNREFEQRELALELKEKAIDDVFDVAVLDYDQQIAYYESLDWDNLYAINPQEYADADRHFKQVKAQKTQLLQAYTQREQAKKAQEEQRKAALAATAVKMIKQDYSLDWEDKYQAGMNHAIEVLGWDENDVLGEIRYPVIKTWIKDYERHQAAQKLQTKVVRKSPPKVVRSGAASTGQQKGQYDQAKLAKAFNSGKLSHEQAFSFLVD